MEKKNPDTFQSTLNIILSLSAYFHAVCNTKFCVDFLFLTYVHKYCEIERCFKREMLGLLNIFLRDLEVFENIAMD